MTAPRPCKFCSASIRLMDLAEGAGWRPVDAGPKYILPSDDGPDQGISERTGRVVRGSWSWPRQGTAIVYPVHVCAAGTEKGSE